MPAEGPFTAARSAPPLQALTSRQAGSVRLRNAHLPTFHLEALQMIQFIRILFLWLFGDFSFAVLPIAIIFIVSRLTGDSVQEFGLIREWSFASIVLFGVSVRR